MSLWLDHNQHNFHSAVSPVGDERAPPGTSSGQEWKLRSIFGEEGEGDCELNWSSTKRGAVSQTKKNQPRRRCTYTKFAIKKLHWPSTFLWAISGKLLWYIGFGADFDWIWSSLFKDSFRSPIYRYVNQPINEKCDACNIIVNTLRQVPSHRNWKRWWSWRYWEKCSQALISWQCHVKWSFWVFSNILWWRSCSYVVSSCIGNQ